ncbi:ribosomal protein S5 domain 2-type protein [Melampsora americana]|nr:ribosomal protein S5 domain 2-type protein [Melampsora americana]KAH9811947.1 ribosomal protein S5 domain 2-type protein [Melampsora americana]
MKSNLNLNLNPIELESYKRLQPLNYLKSQLESNKRSDLIRSIRETREIKINTNSISTAHGSCLVSIGNTSVLCGIRFEVSEPNFTNPNEGFIITNIEIGSICSSKIKSNQSQDQSQIISNQLKNIIKSSEMISLSSLVIQPERLVWTIYLDLICLSNDGNILDASIISINQALQTARQPQVKFDLDTNQIILLDPNEFKPRLLNLNHSIHPLSFSIFEKKFVLVDPSLFEEDHSNGSITIIIDSNEKLRYVSILGDIQDSNLVLNDCIEFSFERFKSNDWKLN